MRYIELTQNQFALVDDWLYDWLNQYSWHALWCERTHSYRARGKVDGKLVYMSRLIVGLSKGDKHQVDHQNNNTLDNQGYNLRVVTNQQNMFNLKSTKGYSKSGNRWMSTICHNGHRQYLGTFNTVEEAREAYMSAKRGLHKIVSKQSL